MVKRRLPSLIVAMLPIMGSFLIAVLYMSDIAIAHLNGFNAGNIMSDFVMSNKDAMSEGQIQSFLKSKNSCNDRDYNKYKSYTAMGYSYNWKDGHFVCMADESFGGESAAHIIWQAAQDYSINPQVLIVLLQKEQSLVTDTWPNSRQYQIATGFGCPDTAPCDTQYYGLKNQIRLAAKLFRDVLDGGWSNYPAYSTVYVRYNQNATCGGSNLYIENRATSALYRYTPYQPNAAALAAGTGTIPSCGAYGNRNFYYYFTEWFGDTREKMFVCNALDKDTVCIWRIVNRATGTEFLSPDINAVKEKMLDNNYTYKGLAFYAYAKTRKNSVPVYELLLNSWEHFYTTNEGEKNAILAAMPSEYLGMPFYVLSDEYRSNSGYPVYRQTQDGVHLYYVDGVENNIIMNSEGYLSEGIGWYAPSGMVETNPITNDRVNVYRLFNNVEHFYTAGLVERDTALRNGWAYEGVAFTTTTKITTPVYRLCKGEHIYALDVAERDSLVTKGWKYEGIAWYVDSSTPQVLEFYDGRGNHFYTANVTEAMNIANRGWDYTGKKFGSTQGSQTPIYRFYGVSHFYTANIDESLKIANKGWGYEGVGFYVSKSVTDKPVYRFLLPNNHFYTASEQEKDLLIKRGEIYEGIAWYADTNSSTPVHRLIYGPRHFFTANLAERDSVIRLGGHYEGIAW